MTDNGCRPVNKEEFQMFLVHFKNNRNISKCLLILDGCASHSKNVHVLEFNDKNCCILSVYWPTAHTGFGRLIEVLLPVTVGLNYFSERAKWLKNNSDSNFTKFQFPKIFLALWLKTATVSITVSAFRSCDIFQSNLESIPDNILAPYEALGANWKLHPGLENILPFAA
jgi:hypothetical protein